MSNKQIPRIVELADIPLKDWSTSDTMIVTAVLYDKIKQVKDDFSDAEWCKQIVQKLVNQVEFRGPKWKDIVQRGETSDRLVARLRGMSFQALSEMSQSDLLFLISLTLEVLETPDKYTQWVKAALVSLRHTPITPSFELSEAFLAFSKECHLHGLDPVVALKDYTEVIEEARDIPKPPDPSITPQSIRGNYPK